MEAVIFIGLQASGKSAFFKERFFDTHVRINLDMLKTRRRERLLLQACIRMEQRFVVDNTNPTAEERWQYIEPAKRSRFRVVGYFFQSRVEDCVRRNDLRSGRARIPAKGIYGTAKRLQLPTRAEGFDQLYVVRIGDANSFVVQEWLDDVR